MQADWHQQLPDERSLRWESYFQLCVFIGLNMFIVPQLKVGTVVCWQQLWEELSLVPSKFWDDCCCINDRPAM